MRHEGGHAGLLLCRDQLYMRVLVQALQQRAGSSIYSSISRVSARTWARAND